MTDSKNDPVEVTSETAMLVEFATVPIPIPDASVGSIQIEEHPDVLALAAHDEAMAILASRGMLTDSHATNLSLRQL
jgi:hypothetical protein